MPDQDSIYQGREQTLVKHVILRNYLKRFAPIVGSWCESITYVDGFAGPWNARSPELSDSSFAIALEELRKARDAHASHHRTIRLRCFFLEQDPGAYAQLSAFAEQVRDAEVVVRNDTFERSIDAISRFIHRGGPKNFPFIFIDPTGWTGFAMKHIAPLLRLDPGEVLVNFMTGHIRRFLHEEQPRSSFVDLFGSDSFRETLQGLSGPDLEDAAVREYMRSLKRKGRFEYVLAASVLHPEMDRTHFHLIYATRHPKGVEVFKGAERQAMTEMERLRAGAQARRREERTRQMGLFGAAERLGSRYYDELRRRYSTRARQDVLSLLQEERRVPYDQAWITALSSQLVWESDLKEWIEEWRRDGTLSVEGLQARERVPKRGQDHVLVWNRPPH